MMDMCKMACKIVGPRFMLALVFAAVAAFAQEPDDMEPAVDTSAMEPAVDTSAIEPAVDTATMEPGVDTADDVDNEVQDLEPAVSSSALAADVSRNDSSGQVMDSLELGRTEVTGNQELPKVLYIVPWQKPEPGDLTGKPVNSLVDEVLAPLDREEFIRQVEYYNDLNGE
jgi:hypothetical protein